MLQRKELRKTSSQLKWRPSHIHMMSLVISDLVVAINYSGTFFFNGGDICFFCTIYCGRSMGYQVWMCIYQATIMLNRWLIVVITFQRVRFIRSYRRVSRDNRAIITQLFSQGAFAVTAFAIYAVIMNFSRMDLPLETLPFNIIFLTLMLPMTALIVYRTKGRTSEPVVEFQKLTFVVAFFSCLSASLDIAAKAPLLSHVENGCIDDNEIDLWTVVWVVISAQFFEMFNCTVNLIIYLALSKQFRRKFVRCVSCASFRRKFASWFDRVKHREGIAIGTDMSLTAGDSTVSVISVRPLPEV